MVNPPGVGESVGVLDGLLVGLLVAVLDIVGVLVGLPTVGEFVGVFVGVVVAVLNGVFVGVFVGEIVAVLVGTFGVLVKVEVGGVGKVGVATVRQPSTVIQTAKSNNGINPIKRFIFKPPWNKKLKWVKSRLKV